MTRKILIALAAALAMSAGAAYAKSSSQNDAGCGLGGMLVKDNIAWQQVVAAFLNGTGMQTFAISTGTSGCQSGGLGKTAQARRDFVAANYRDLSRQIAAGGGEYVASLSSLMGCSSSADFAKFAQSKYEALFPSTGTQPEAMLQNLWSEMAKDTTMSVSCNI